MKFPRFSSKHFKRLFRITIVVAFLAVITIHLLVQRSTTHQLYDTVESVPYNHVGLLLGTSKTLSNGKMNDYFVKRIDATVLLLKNHKIDRVVISGDNSVESYNEPEDMRQALIQQGVADSLIYLDFAGFRTYDSVFRMKAIFGQQAFTIISQEFHNHRAVFIANSLGLKTVAYNAAEVTAFWGVKTKVREFFSRVKMLIDLAVGKKPHFLGKPIQIH